MRKTEFVFVILLLATVGAIAQQELAPSTEQGPLNIQPQTPRPDNNGVFTPGPGVVAPIVILRVAAVYPPDAPSEAIDGYSIVSMVIGEDGVPANIQVVHTHGASFDAASIAAVRQSKFAPGTVNGKPVPVHMFARTRFHDDMRAAYPKYVASLAPSAPTGFSGFGNRPAMARGDTPPRPLTTVEADFTDAARKNKIQGIVTVSVLVNEDGIPIDPQIVHSLEPGLDERAIEAVLKYRFLPAMHEGEAIAKRIIVSINFRLY